jgi:hypothetical protein
MAQPHKITLAFEFSVLTLTMPRLRFGKVQNPACVRTLLHPLPEGLAVLKNPHLLYLVAAATIDRRSKKAA